MKLTESVLRNMIRQEIKKSLNEAQSSLLNDIVTRLTAHAEAKVTGTKNEAELQAELAQINQMVAAGLKAGEFSPQEFIDSFPPSPSKYKPVGSFGARKIR